MSDRVALGTAMLVGTAGFEIVMGLPVQVFTGGVGLYAVAARCVCRATESHLLWTLAALGVSVATLFAGIEFGAGGGTADIGEAGRLWQGPARAAFCGLQG
jgi:hypothetical protein